MSPLVWVHGWAMNAAVWQPMLAYFPHHLQQCLTLPGHGAQALVEGHLEAWGEALAATQARGVWVGWSLGGLMVLWMAQHYPERVEKIVLIAATPKFTAAEDWPCGVRPRLFEGFSEALETDTVGTLKRFMGLQMLHVRSAKSVVQNLQHQVEQSPPKVPALITGLALLKNTDLRATLSALSCPLQLILGARDTLVSVQTAAAVRAVCPNVQIEVIAGAGHVPFLSHPQQVYEKMAAFI